MAESGATPDRRRDSPGRAAPFVTPPAIMPSALSISPLPARRLAAVSLAALLAGCGGGGDAPSAPGTPPSTPSQPGTPSAIALRVPVDTVRPGGVVRVVVPGGGAPATAAGTLGGAAISMARENDSTLVALVPDVAAASQPLALTLGARAAQATVRVQPAPVVGDPVATVDAYLDAMTARYAGGAPVGFSAGEWATERAPRQGRPCAMASR